MRECPQRPYGFRPPPATGANATSVLALTAPSGTPATVTNHVPSSSRSIGSSFGYQPRPRTNWWKENQERLDKVYNKFVQDEESEKRKKELEEMEKKKKEEDDRRNEWKKERERLETEMAYRLDKRFEELGLKKKEVPNGNSQSEEMMRLKHENEELLKKINGGGNEFGKNDELARLRCENEDLRRKVSGEGSSQRDGEGMSRLQQEIYELHKLVGSKQSDDDEIFALKQELSELKQ
ncbi:hypothetical protein CBR_g90480, partial [Chara braunii]